MPDSSNPFLPFWQAGYRDLVPIVPPGATPAPNSTLARRPKAIGKAPGIKGADGLWRGFDWAHHNTAAEDLVRWHLMGAGVGIRAGGALSLAAVDIDTLSPNLAVEIARAAETHLGDAPVRVGRAPKLLLLYRTSAPVSYRRVLFDDGGAPGAARVELLSGGRQFVAHGTHPDTGLPYQWPSGVWPASRLNTVSGDALNAFFAHLSDVLPGAQTQDEAAPAADRTHVDQAALRGELEDVRAAISALPNTAAVAATYDEYVRVGIAIKAATQDDPSLGLELFQQWAGRWTDGHNDPEAVASDWRRMKPPFSLGAQYLFDLAARHGSFDRVRVYLDPIEDGAATAENPAAGARSATEAAKYQFLLPPARAALAAASEARPLIKGLLDAGSMAVLYGESNTGKTFVALDMAWHIAAGQSYGGMKTTQGPVVYVVAEGGRGMAKRMAALVQTRPQTAGAPLWTLSCPIDLLNPDADLVPLTRALLALPERPALIVLDTLSRVLAGGDENSSTDMGALVKHFDLLRAGTAAALMTVHHSGKDRARGARGHSLLRAATDTEIEIAENRIAVTKQRDLDKSWSSPFALEPVTVARDPDGDAIVSCTVRLVSDEQAAEMAIGKGPTPAEGAVLEAAAALAGTNLGGSNVVQVSALLAYLQDNLSSETTKQGLNKLLLGLSAKKLISRPEKGFVRVNHPVNRPVNHDVFH